MMPYLKAFINGGTLVTTLPAHYLHNKAMLGWQGQQLFI